MLYINKVTNNPFQNVNLTGIPGVVIAMSLRFFPRNNLWMAGFSVNGEVVANGIAVVSALNLMRQFKNNTSFGIACLTTNGFDPSTVNDFANQTANLYLLDSSDVAAVENHLTNP